ncbi:MAG TPA: OmpA family protein, partial [Candidatus Binataceae bacterium]|nr:OmpA family protein [Candidatus Binataceae bacterium]
DKSKAKAVSESIQEALNNGVLSQKAVSILAGSIGGIGKGNAKAGGPAGKTSKRDLLPDAAPSVDLVSSLNTLTAQLKDEIKRGTVQLKLESRGLVIGLTAAAFFPSGDDAIEPSAFETMGKVAAVLNKIPNALRLEGHTDSVPINTPRFRSNWELSAARSIAVLRLLNEKFGVALERMGIAGYADLAAIDSNDTEEGRARNRRVDIVVLNEYGMRSEPARAEAKPAAAAAPGGQIFDKR